MILTTMQSEVLTARHASALLGVRIAHENGGILCSSRHIPVFRDVTNYLYHIRHKLEAMFEV